MLNIENVSVVLGGKPILQNVSFTLRPHRLTALVGRNGSGKSTLLGCVNQQIPYTGRITEGGRNLADMLPRERAKSIAILPQTLPVPAVTVKEMVAFGRTPYLDFTGKLREHDRTAIQAAMKSAQITDLQSRTMDTLSGGERQRVALGMILAQKTPIALLDEPTAHMDLGFEAAFLKQLRWLREKEDKTFLVILHDLNMAVRYADDILVLDEGKLRFAGTVENCLEKGILEETFHLKRYSIEENGEKRIFFSGE